MRPPLQPIRVFRTEHFSELEYRMSSGELFNASYHATITESPEQGDGPMIEEITLEVLELHDDATGTWNSVSPRVTYKTSPRLYQAILGLCERQALRWAKTQDCQSWKQVDTTRGLL